MSASLESPEVQRLVWDQSVHPVLVLDSVGRVQDSNASARGFRGLDAPGSTEKPVWELDWMESPQDRELMRDGVTKAAGGAFFRGDVRVVESGGTPRILDCTLKPLQGDSGEIRRLLLEARDVTDQKSVEEEVLQTASELARSNAELQHFASIANHELQEQLRMVESYGRLLEKHLDGRLDPDSKECISYMMGGAKRMKAMVQDLLAYSNVEVERKFPLGSDRETNLQRANEDLRSAIKEGGASLHPTSLRVLLVEDNPGDVRLVQEAFKDRSRTFRFELEHAETCGQATERLKKERFDVVLLDLSLPDCQGLECVTRVRVAAPSVPIVILTGFDDEALAVMSVRKGVQDYMVKGQMDGSLLVRSLSYAVERQRVMAELEQLRQQQLELKDQFLSHVSHELRTPLYAVYQFITILLDGLAGEVPPQQRECLDIALNNVHQLRRMVDDLLDVIRTATGKLKIEPQMVLVGELISETAGGFQARAGEKDIKLSTEVQGQLPSVYADPQRVEQILNNLVDNALKFTPENGTVKVRASVHDQDSSFLRIQVEDSGCGISPEGIERIFDNLHQEANTLQASRKGLGLGLSICKELASQQGGAIWAESELGRGSVFSFTLPLFTSVEAASQLSVVGTE